MVRAPVRRSQVYEIETEFAAPREFVFRWCTDYRPDDAKLEGAKFQRWILERDRAHVVFEDLDRSRNGWNWTHWTISLHPPTHWHGESTGSHRGWSIDYRLDARPGGRTRLRLRGRRTPTALGAPNPPRATMEAELRSDWRRFGRRIERDYRRAARHPRSRK